VAPTPWGTGGTCPPTFTNGLAIWMFQCCQHFINASVDSILRDALKWRVIFVNGQRHVTKTSIASIACDRCFICLLPDFRNCGWPWCFLLLLLFRIYCHVNGRCASCFASGTHVCVHAHWLNLKVIGSTFKPSVNGLCVGRSGVHRIGVCEMGAGASTNRRRGGQSNPFSELEVIKIVRCLSWYCLRRGQN